MIGNSTTNHTIVSGVYGSSSNPTAGYFGNMMQRKNITLNLELESNKTYYWYIQTIDTGLAKSNWSIVQSFTTANDTTKPTITINSPSPNNTLHTINPIFTFNITVTDANLTNATLYADFNGTMIANETNSSGVNGTYIFNKTLNTDGVYQWYIEAWDSDNNSQTSAMRTFYLDRASPVVTSISPASGSTSASASVTFSYNVSDVDIANCSLIINNVIDQTDTSVTENTTQTFNKTMSNGNYNWYVNCTDYVGYINSSAMRSLTVSVSSTNGGSSGGSGGSSAKTYSPTEAQLKEGYTNSLSTGDKMSFGLGGENHSLEIVNIIGTIINITLNSNPINFILGIGEERRFDLDNNSIYDLLVRLNSVIYGKANLTIKEINESISLESRDGEINQSIIENENEVGDVGAEKDIAWIYVIVVGLIISGIIGVILWRKKHGT